MTHTGEPPTSMYHFSKNKTLTSTVIQTIWVDELLSGAELFLITLSQQKATKCGSNERQNVFFFLPQSLFFGWEVHVGFDRFFVLFLWTKIGLFSLSQQCTFCLFAAVLFLFCLEVSIGLNLCSCFIKICICFCTFKYIHLNVYVLELESLKV